jgi:hypothetical protein
MPDQAPYAEAFDEFALLTLIELLEEVARFHDAWLRVCDADDDEDDEDDDEEQAGSALTARETDTPDGSDRDQVPCANRPAAERLLDLALAAGYMLRVKADGWKLFCDRLSVPPLRLWEETPGYQRVMGCLEIAERAAFTADGFLRWLNDVRPAGAPRVTALTLTADMLADSLEGVYRKRAKYHAGG